MVILFDIGGTKTRIARAISRNRFDRLAIFQTPKNYRDGVMAIDQTVKKISAGAKIHHMIGGAPSPLDKGKKILLNAPNLPQWNGKSFAVDLQKRLKASIHLENDASLVGLGEAVFGAGKGKKIVAYITVSTGVGGALIVQKNIQSHQYSFEPGHQILSYGENGSKPMSLQDFISGHALEKRMKKKVSDIPQSSEIWDQLALSLAVGIHNTIVYWCPDIIVIGGSMITKDPCIPFDRIVQSLQSISKIYPHLPLVAKATLGDLGGLYGGLAMTKHIARD